MAGTQKTLIIISGAQKNPQTNVHFGSQKLEKKFYKARIIGTQKPLIIIRGAPYIYKGFLSTPYIIRGF